MNESESQRESIPWWLWPNVLNLDAPVVAVVWQEMFARVVGAPLAAEHRWLLFLAVWQIYFVDRWLDSRRDPGIQTDRHRFHRGVGGMGWVVEAAVFMVSIALAVRCLNPAGWAGAGALLAMSGICFAMTHYGQSRWYLVLPKELWIGAIFACGCALQPWTLAAAAPKRSFFWVVLFAALCFLNCAAIALWEDQRADRENPRSLLNRWPGFRRSFPIWSMLLSFLAIWIGFVCPGAVNWFGAGAAVGLGALGLAVLNRLHSPKRARALCALADVALLAPIPWILFL